MKKTLIAALLAGSSFAALAVPTALTFDVDNSAWLFSKPAAGSFLDEYTFQLPFAQASFSSSFSTSVNGSRDIDFTSISLTDGNTTLYNFVQTSTDSTGSEQWTLNNAALSAATTYHLVLVGTSAVGSTLYTGELSVVSAVPEPSTWAMGLAGLAAMAFIARRRQG